MCKSGDIRIGYWRNGEPVFGSEVQIYAWDDFVVDEWFRDKNGDPDKRGTHYYKDGTTADF